MKATALLVLLIAYMLSGSTTDEAKLDIVSREVNMVTEFGQDIEVDERGRIQLVGLNGNYGCSFLRQQGSVVKTYLTCYDTKKDYLMVYHLVNKQLRCYEVAE